MINKEIGFLCLAITAAGVFLMARSLNSAPALPEASPPTAQNQATPTQQPTNPPAVAANVAPSAAEKPVAAPTAPVAKIPAPTAPTAAPAPVAPKPAPVRQAANPDDSPTRTKNTKVQASTNTQLPPAFGPVVSKVHVIVYSDFQ